MSLFCPTSYLSHVLFLANKLKKKTTTKSIWEDKRALYQIPAVFPRIWAACDGFVLKRPFHNHSLWTCFEGLARKKVWNSSVLLQKPPQ